MSERDYYHEARPLLDAASLSLHQVTNVIAEAGNEINGLRAMLDVVDDYARWAAIDIVNGKTAVPFEQWYQERYGE